MNELETLSKEMRTATIEEMQAVLKSEESTPDLFHGMMHYHMGWRDREMLPTDVNSGKQIRPVLLLLVCKAAGGEWQQAVPAAAAVELLHNFTLIHDDIEDANPLRRGRESLWKIWGIAQAINTGDALFALAHIALTRLADRGVPAERVIRALRRFDETSVHISQGQHADFCFEQRQQVSVDEYIDMISGKTAALLALCSELGALIAGADDYIVALYHHFGLHCGLAFQTMDDILGIWGDEYVIGKSSKSDIIGRKKTLPILYGLQNSTELRELYEKSGTCDSFTREVIELLNQAGARDFAIEKAAAHTQLARTNLEAARPAGDARNALNQLIDRMSGRHF